MNFKSEINSIGKLNLFKSNILIVLIIIILTSLVYTSAINNEFTNWDDNIYVTNNKFIKDCSWDGVKHILTKRTKLGGTKFTLLSFMLDYKIWKLNPVPYHAENVLWHILNSVLLFYLFLRLTRNRNISFVVAILFALHPMHVESVAWISERKDVLYTFFLLLCLHFYLRYIDSKKTRIKSIYWFLFTFSFYISYHSKFSAVLIPFLLFLIDFYLKRKLSWILIIEKLPMLAFVGNEVYRIVFGPHANVTNVGKSIVKVAHPTDKFSLPDKFFLASYSVLFYIRKFLLPFNLSAIIPYPVKTNGQFPDDYLISFISLIILFCLIVFFLVKFKKNRHEYIFGLLFFLISISIFTHFISIKGLVVVADRYTYIPYIGLSFIIGIIINDLASGRKKQLAWILFSFVVIALGIASFQRNKVWKDNITLFTDVLNKNPNVGEALNNRGNAYYEKGMYQQALQDLNRGIEATPQLIYLYNSRAMIWHKLDSMDNAIADLNKAIRLDPYYIDAYINKGNIMSELKKYKEAVEIFSLAMKIAPRKAILYIYRAKTYESLNKSELAEKDYNYALTVFPKNTEAIFSLGMMKLKVTKYEEALKEFKKVTEINPLIPEAYNEIGNILNKKGQFNEALVKLEKAIELNSNFAEAYNNRGITFFHLKKYSEALIDFNKAIEIDSVFANAFANRGNLWVFQGKPDFALADYNKAISLNPKDYLTLVNRGNIYFQLKSKKAACDDWKNAANLKFEPATDLVKLKCK